MTEPKRQSAIERCRSESSGSSVQILSGRRRSPHLARISRPAHEEQRRRQSLLRMMDEDLFGESVSRRLTPIDMNSTPRSSVSRHSQASVIITEEAGPSEIPIREKSARRVAYEMDEPTENTMYIDTDDDFALENNKPGPSSSAVRNYTEAELLDAPFDYDDPAEQAEMINEDLLVQHIQSVTMKANATVERTSDESRSNVDDEEEEEEEEEEGNETDADVTDPQQKKKKKIKKKPQKRSPKPKREPQDYRKVDVGLSQSVQIINVYPRPVMYKNESLSVADANTAFARRTRITKRIKDHPVQQFHLETTTVPLKQVECWRLGETVDSYVDASKLYTQTCELFGDEMVPTAVEYDGNIKVLNFSAELKKLSCSQKRKRFQTAWWNRLKTAFQKTKEGTISEPTDSFKTVDDISIFETHFLKSGYTVSMVQMVLGQIAWRINKRRTSDDVIVDSAYFVREFFLPKSAITLRITTAADVPTCFVPPALNCGYFPFSAVTVKDKKHYLMCRYKEAQLDYLNFAYRDLTPPPRFKVSCITSTELYEYHKSGRHIHGFFLVWEEIDKYHVDENGKSQKKRYLVDMYNFLRFPLYINFERWEAHLKTSFDHTSIYNLHLAEIIRLNRPVFDTLAQNPAFFQPLTLEEMTNLMDEKEISAKYFLESVGDASFYSWGRNSTNSDYLSAYLIICGGTKQAIPIKEYRLNQNYCFNSNTDCPSFLAKTGETLQLETPISAKEVFIYDKDAENELQHVIMRPPLPEDHHIPTQVICTIPSYLGEAEDDLLRRTRGKEEIRMTRAELIEVRKKIYNYDPDFEFPIDENFSNDLLDEQMSILNRTGRKPIDMVAVGLKRHDFDITFIPSDIESDYEGFLDGKEPPVDVAPKLKRSTSSDSIFMDFRYNEYMANELAWNHQQHISKKMQQSMKRRRRKMDMKVQRHLLRFKTNHTEDDAFEEMVECYHSTFPRTALEVANTKNAIRKPDEVCDVLKKAVCSTVAVEHSCSRAANGMCLQLQKARINRIETTEALPIRNDSFLPPARFLAAEMLGMDQVVSESTLDDFKAAMLKMTDDMMAEFRRTPKAIRRQLYNSAKLKRKRLEVDELWARANHCERELRRPRKSALLELSKGKRTAAHQKQQEAKRRAARRKVAEKKRKAKQALLTPEELAAQRKKAIEDMARKRKEARKRQKELEEFRKNQQRRKEAREAEEVNRKRRRELEKVYEAEREQREKELKEQEEKKKQEEEAERKRLLKQAADKKLLEKRAALKAKKMKEIEAANKKKAEEEAEKEKKKKELELEFDRLAKNRLEKERQEKERLEKERLEKERLERERLEKDRLEKEKQEKARLENERLEKERLEKERLEKERMDKERLEKERQDKERLEKEQLEKEQEKLEKERKEKERIEKENQEKEKERLEKEAQEKKKKEEEVEAERKRLQDQLEKEKLEKKIIKQEDPEDPVISLYMISKDPLLPEYEEARREFRKFNPRAMIVETSGLVLWLVKTLKISSDSLIEYIGSMIEPPDTRAIVPGTVKSFFHNVARGYKYQMAEDNTKKWVYKTNCKTLSRGLPSPLKNSLLSRAGVQKTPARKDGKIDFNQLQHLTPATVVSTMKQSLLQSGSLDPNLILPEFDFSVASTGEFLAHPTAERCTISFTPVRATGTEMRPQLVETPKVRELRMKAKNGKGNTDTSPSTAGRQPLWKRMRNVQSDEDISDNENHGNNQNENLDGNVDENPEPIQETTWTPAEITNSEFWTIIANLESVNITEEGRVRLSSNLAVLCSERPIQEYFSWIFAIVGAIQTMLTGTIINSEASRRDKHADLVAEDFQEVENVTSSILKISSYFEEARKNPANLNKLIAFNGFAQVFKFISVILTNISSLALDLAIQNYFNEGVTPQMILNEIVSAISKRFDYMLPEESNLSAESLSHLQRDQEDVQRLICEEKYHKKGTTREERLRAQRINTIIDWYNSTIHYHKSGIARIREETIRRLHLKLNNTNWEVVEIFSNNPANWTNDENEKPSLGDLGVFRRSPSIDADDLDVIAVDDQEAEQTLLPTPMAEKTLNVAEEEVLPNESFAAAEATFTMPNKQKRKELRAAAQARRRVEAAKDRAFPTKLPKHEVAFVDSALKAIERTIARFNENDKRRMQVYNEFSKKHFTDSSFRFHLMINTDVFEDEEETENSYSQRQIVGDQTWKYYTRLNVEEDAEQRLISENKILDMFENTVLTREEFNKMQWTVDCSDGTVKHAIEYFTDLDKYCVESRYRHSMKDRVLKFKFKLFKHLWFMGGLLPADSEYVDSHEDMEEEDYCPGCTHGDVVIIHNCTCEYHNDHHTKTFIYAYSNEPIGLYMVSRLLGRFVCKHGPSSFLQLDRDPPTYDSFTPKSSKYVEFAGKLWVSKKKTMFAELVDTFSNPKTQHRHHHFCGSCSPISTASSGSETVVLGSNSESSYDTEFEDTEDEYSSLEDSDDDDDIRIINETPGPRAGERHSVIVLDSSDNDSSEGLHGDEPDCSLVQEHSEEHKKQLKIDIELMKAHSDRLTARIARLEDPVRRALRERNFNIRSKSCEADKLAPRVDLGSLRRSSSQIRLREVVGHAKRKIREAKRKIGFNSDFMTNASLLSHQGWFDQEVSDSSSMFNGAESVFEGSKRYEVVAAMLDSKQFADDREDHSNKCQAIEALMANQCFHQYCGSRRTSLPTFTEEGVVLTGNVVSLVMDEYLKFEEYKKTKMTEAKIMIEQLKTLRNQENRGAVLLITTYEKIFKFNLCLLEHFLDLITKNIFNPQANYHVEKKGDSAHLKKIIHSVKLSMGIVLNAFFNIEPLKRQLMELSSLQPLVPPADYKHTVSALAKHAIERIRVPQTVDKELNKFSWLNSTMQYEDTITLLLLDIRGMLPDDMVEEDFKVEAKHFLFRSQAFYNHGTNFTHDCQKTVRALVETFYMQSESFYHDLTSHLPSGTVDKIMKLYYTHQTFIRIFDIVQMRKTLLTFLDMKRSTKLGNAMMMAAFAGTAKPFYNMNFHAHVLEGVYQTLKNIESKPILVSPSYLGISFHSFKDGVFISAVRETRVATDPNFKFHGINCVRPGECSIDLKFSTCEVLLNVNPDNGMAFITFCPYDQNHKDDRLPLDAILPNIRHNLRWGASLTFFVSYSFNLIKRIINKMPMVKGYHEPIGRLENADYSVGKMSILGKRRMEARQSPKSKRIYQEVHSVDSDSDAGEDLEEVETLNIAGSTSSKKRRPIDLENPTAKRSKP